MSKYAWHPPHPPSPPDPAISSKIAAIGPIGKCLEEALNELLSEQDHDDSVHDEDGDSSSHKSNKLDESLAKTIIKSYADAVATTSYDHRTKNTGYHCTKNQSSDAKHTTAPAALLKGEIEYYNRIGGQWRIIVKNAVLMPRRVKVDFGKNGRRRVMLDFDQDIDTETAGDEDAEMACAVGESGSKKRKMDDPDIHRFDGSVEILAYNDDA